jgi:alkylhydroperoxidase/carboxymuconolactone decarboxylase family protein YurZ
MAQGTTRLGSVDELRKRFPDVAEGFQAAMRKAVDGAGPLDTRTRELILLAGYITGRQSEGFKTHASRALAAGATPEEVRHACVLVLGATAALEPVVDALIWADEVIAARG